MLVLGTYIIGWMPAILFSLIACSDCIYDTEDVSNRLPPFFNIPSFTFISSFILSRNSPEHSTKKRCEANKKNSPRIDGENTKWVRFLGPLLFSTKLCIFFCGDGLAHVASFVNLSEKKMRDGNNVCF